jgi:hypothetical protein
MLSLPSLLSMAFVGHDLVMTCRKIPAKLEMSWYTASTRSSIGHLLRRDQHEQQGILRHVTENQLPHQILERTGKDHRPPPMLVGISGFNPRKMKQGRKVHRSLNPY